MKKGSKYECINIYLGATFEASTLSIDAGKFELNQSVADTHSDGQNFDHGLVHHVNCKRLTINHAEVVVLRVILN